MDFGHREPKRRRGRAALAAAGLAAFLLALVLAACGSGPTAQAAPTGTSAPAASPTLTAEPPQSPTAEAVAVPAPSPTPAPTATPAAVFYEPAGCWQPPEDYARVNVGEAVLNARTAAMLRQAAVLYGGEIDVAGGAILGGSYGSPALDDPDAHLGGGAVDLAVTSPTTKSVLYTEIEPLIRALRTVGFAAWLRQDTATEFGPGYYIHAIAIGDAELALAAQEELTGPSGYLRGFDGLPATGGEPAPDSYGGPLVCRWMVAAGYADLRPPTPELAPGLPWQERLRLAAEKYIANYPEDAEVVARSLNFLDGKSEAANNICGPLSGAILRDAGLLPNQVGPVQDLKSYWQSRPVTNGRPWSLFPMRDYEVFRYDTPLAEFDFKAWPLQPGDFLYTYAREYGYEHMFVVTEVDAEGRAYTVTNQYQSWANEIWGSMLIQRYLLYDPTTPGAGIIYNQWQDRRLGQTGHNGFEVLRKRGMVAGSLYAYTVRPGDTLPELAARYGAGPESIAQANPGVDLASLQVGQPLTIPIPAYTPAPVQAGPSATP